MDSMGIIESPEIKVSLLLLRDSLLTFSGLANASVRKKSIKRRFKFSSVDCLRHKIFMSVDYCLWWHMDKFVHFQEKFVTTADTARYFSDIESTGFNNYEQLEQIQHTFLTIIKNQVKVKGVIFYYGGDTMQRPSS
jgi:hypothetical protein